MSQVLLFSVRFKINQKKIIVMENVPKRVIFVYFCDNLARAYHERRCALSSMWRPHREEAIIVLRIALFVCNDLRSMFPLEEILRNRYLPTVMSIISRTNVTLQILSGPVAPILPLKHRIVNIRWERRLQFCILYVLRFLSRLFSFWCFN